MEIWTRSRIHARAALAAFLSSPQTARQPEHIPRAGFRETKAIMEVIHSPAAPLLRLHRLILF